MKHKLVHFLAALCLLTSCTTLSSRTSEIGSPEEVLPLASNRGEYVVPGTLVAVTIPWSTAIAADGKGLISTVGDSTILVTATLGGDNQFTENLIGDLQFSSYYGARWYYYEIGQRKMVLARRTIMSSEGSYHIRFWLISDGEVSQQLKVLQSVVASAKINIDLAQQNYKDPVVTLPNGFDWVSSRHDKTRSVYRMSTLDSKGVTHYYTLTTDRIYYPGINKEQDGKLLITLTANKTLKQHTVQTIEPAERSGKIYVDYYYTEGSDMYFTKNIGYWIGNWFVFAQLKQIDEITDPQFFDQGYRLLEKVRFDPKLFSNGEN